MGITLTKILQLIKPNLGQERGRWGEHLNANFDKLDKLVSLNRKNLLSWDLPHMPASGTYYPYGFEGVLVAGATLAGIPLVVSPGTSKISLDVKAGTDLAGSVELSGDSRHASTGETIVADTETIAISGVGVYTSKKTWVGDVTLTASSLDISDLDVLSISLMDTLGQPYELETVRLLGTSTTSGLTLTTEIKVYQQSGATLEISEVSGGKLDIGSTPSGTKKWDLTLEPGVGTLNSDNGEGLVASLALTGTPGDWLDLRLLLSYRIRPNTT